MKKTNNNIKKMRADARKQIGFRQPRIKSGMVVEDKKRKEQNRAKRKAENRKIIREYL